MSYWPTISQGAVIDIIAPSGRFDPEVGEYIDRFVRGHGWIPRLSGPLLAPHDFLANSDTERSRQLICALTAVDSDIVWCVRGGHGTTRLMKELLALPKPAKPKLVVGFSDITTFHLFLNQTWQWPSLHAPMARQVAMGESDSLDINALLALWQGGLASYELTDLLPQNAAARAIDQCTGVTAGTCLSLLQTSLATPWQIQADRKIVFVEDINETAYRLDRLLVHLSNAAIWHKAAAIVLGDFGEQPNSTEQRKIQRVLSEFSAAQTVPVFSMAGFGHGTRNRPIPLGVPATLRADAGVFSMKFGAAL